MNYERDVNVAVQLMFKHAKALVSRNLVNAIKRGDITIDESKIPGLEKLIHKSIDDGYVQSTKQLSSVIASHKK